MSDFAYSGFLNQLFNDEDVCETCRGDPGGVADVLFPLYDLRNFLLPSDMVYIDGAIERTYIKSMKRSITRHETNTFQRRER